MNYERLETMKVQYDHQKYRPHTYGELVRQKEWELIIEAISINEAKKILKEEHNLNPFYFKFIGISEKGGKTKK